MAASPPYVELATRSAFSFLEGGSLPEDLVEVAAQLGHASLGLADVDGVYGAPRFHQRAREKGLRARVGAHVTLLDAESAARPPRAAGH